MASSASSFHILLILCVIILRLLVALHPHSGQDNYHGSVKSYGGDYEAQRHWMELTLHLPLREWYTHDLQYWGLDYPPLTAYVSYLCGFLSHYLVGPETVQLYTSRYGSMDKPTLLYTDTTDIPRSIQYTHKAFMRLSVVALDICIFFTAVWILAYRLANTDSSLQKTPTTDNTIVFRFILLSALIQPALILIDHGHFQYNCVCLGLSLWSFHSMTQSSFYPSCIVASIAFSLALNFKQMTLYYAPAVFFYLLGRCLAPMKQQHQNRQSIASYQQALYKSILRIFMLGIAVLSTFFILWYPFVYYRDTSTTTPLGSIQIILQRLFPFQRGMFEGKVANIWCSLSIRPISIRSRIPIQYQPLAALGLTSLLMLPFGILLFYLGLSFPEKDSSKPIHNSPVTTSLYHLKTLLWGSTGTALAFFLASFQVHEKSILLAMTPASLLIYEFPTFILWLSWVALWSMWPLIHVDRLSIAYGTCAILFVVILLPIIPMENRKKDVWKVFGSYATSCRRMVHLYFILCLILMMFLHGAELVYTPPVHMPDLFPMIWSITGCSMFCISWIIVLFSCYQSMNESVGSDAVIRDKID